MANMLVSYEHYYWWMIFDRYVALTQYASHNASKPQGKKYPKLIWFLNGAEHNGFLRQGIQWTCCDCQLGGN